MELSNNALIALVVVAMAFSLAGTMTMISIIPGGPSTLTGMDTLTQTGVANVTLATETAIILDVSVVDFGDIAGAVGTQNDTTNYSPHPFVIQNNGTVTINISIAEQNGSGGELWDEDNNCEYCFQFNSTHNVSASDAVAFYNWKNFDTTNWAENNSAGDVYADDANLVYNLSVSAYANVNLNISVPSSEGAGQKTATIFFKAYASAS